MLRFYFLLPALLVAIFAMGQTQTVTRGEHAPVTEQTAYVLQPLMSELPPSGYLMDRVGTPRQFDFLDGMSTSSANVSLAGTYEITLDVLRNMHIASPEPADLRAVDWDVAVGSQTLSTQNDPLEISLLVHDYDRLNPEAYAAGELYEANGQLHRASGAALPLYHAGHLFAATTVGNRVYGPTVHFKLSSELLLSVGSN